MLEPIANVFGVSIAELISGNAVNNVNISANMLRSKFYVCPVCGNMIHSMGEAVIQCHGVMLTPCQAETVDENHRIHIEIVEDEYYIQIEHNMTKIITFLLLLHCQQIRFRCVSFIQKEMQKQDLK